MSATKRILLIIGGGIAAYKSIDLMRRLQEQGAEIRVIMTAAACKFITPLLVSGAGAGVSVYTALFDPKSEFDVGHIRLAREADLIVVAPATADLIAKSAHGLADDLASTTLLACQRPVLFAPAMNPSMWQHPATRRNVAMLKENNAQFIGPEYGKMAEDGESGFGRLAETTNIIDAINRNFSAGPLAGRTVLVSAGPTCEPIDPIRFLSNRSSGRQGYAIAAAAVRAGAHVTLISGPVCLDDPAGCKMVKVESAEEMLAAVKQSLPADIAIMSAAVSDWRAAQPGKDKIKKSEHPGGYMELRFTENPDILAEIAACAELRPQILVGFAAETKNLHDHARAKREKKGADYIIANDVGANPAILGGADTKLTLFSAEGIEEWPEMDKGMAGERLIKLFAEKLAQSRN